MQRSSSCRIQDNFITTFQSNNSKDNQSQNFEKKKEKIRSDSTLEDFQIFFYHFFSLSKEAQISFEYDYSKIEDLQLLKMIGFDIIQNLAQEFAVEAQTIFLAFEYFDKLISSLNEQEINEKKVKQFALVALILACQINDCQDIHIDIMSIFNDKESQIQINQYYKYLVNEILNKNENLKIYEMILYTCAMCNVNTKQFLRVQKMLPVALSIKNSFQNINFLIITLVLIVTNFSEENIRILNEITQFRLENIEAFSRNFYNLFKQYLTLPLYSIYNNQFRIN